MYKNQSFRNFIIFINFAVICDKICFYLLIIHYSLLLMATVNYNKSIKQYIIIQSFITQQYLSVRHPTQGLARICTNALEERNNPTWLFSSRALYDSCSNCLVKLRESDTFLSGNAKLGLMFPFPFLSGSSILSSSINTSGMIGTIIWNRNCDSIYKKKTDEKFLDNPKK